MAYLIVIVLIIVVIYGPQFWSEYIPKDNLPAARRILTACTLTYIASALASLLNVEALFRSTNIFC